MPDWSIRIVASQSGTSFIPDLHGAQAGDPLQASQDDLVTWNNTTNEEHQPWPTDAEYNPYPDDQVQRGTASYLSDVIPAGDSSRPSYDVVQPSNPAPSTWTIHYFCKLHPSALTERGRIFGTVIPTA
jgi:hypothetical protein